MSGVIHTCWFGPARPPALVQKCWESWKNHGYVPRVWEGREIPKSRFFRECLQSFRWAQATDYARWWIMVHHGGIYMDSDIELHSNLGLLQDQFFMRIDPEGKVDGSMMRLKKGNVVAKAMLESFHHKKATDSKHKIAIVNPILRQHGFTENSVHFQEVGGIHLYPYWVGEEHATHHKMNSWKH